MAFYWACFAICLVIASCDIKRSLVYSKENHDEKGKALLLRFKRNQQLGCRIKGSVTSNTYGYYVLDKGKIKVKFLLTDKQHVARVEWKQPEVKRVPVDKFLITWTGRSLNARTDCKLVSNETTKYDIRAAPMIWKYNDILLININPIPTNAPIIKTTFLSFTPDYSENKHHTTPTQVVAEKKSTAQSTGTTRNITNNGANSDSEGTQQQEYSLKLIVGSVIGIAMAIVLLIIFVKTCCGPPPPRTHKDKYYISFFAENDNFVKEVKKFARWLHENGFEVEMLTDENDMLTEKNKSLRRDLMSFTFREHMIKTSDKVFIILSSSYARLCESGERNGTTNQNPSGEVLENLVYSEIVQIRCELIGCRYRSHRFIPICFGLNRAASIPFWIRELLLFSWPEDKTELFNRLSGLPECSLDSLA